MSSQEPQLARKLTLPSLIAFGVAYMSPGIVVSTFGVISVASNGAAPTAYAITTMAMLLTALSYSKMARLFPTSGSVYNYTRKMLGSRIGFLAGWAILLDYFFLPMVAWLIQATYLHTQFPAVPLWGWLALNIVVTTAINIYGVALADRVNRTLLALSITVLVALVAFCVYYLAGHNTGAPTAGFWSPAASLPVVAGGAAIAAYSFLGFDAVSTLAEETRRPERTVPRGIVGTVLVGGLIFVIISFLLQWVHPGSSFTNPDSAGYALATLIGGSNFANVINIAGVVGGFASGLAIQASTSRLLYVMGRDGALPKRFFGYLHPRFRTPVWNLLLIGAIAMIALALDLATAQSFINFGAFLGFTLVNLCVITYFIRQARHGTRRSVFGYLLLPLAGAAVDVYLLTKLSAAAIYLGIGWLILGTIYLTVITRGFRTTPPELSPTSEKPPPTEVAS